MHVFEQLPVPNDKPKSFLLFVAGLAIGTLVFVPMIVAALALEKVPLLLYGAAGLAIAWLPAAYMGFLFTARLAAGHYRNLEARAWKEQVW
jgi:hypothetical protein